MIKKLLLINFIFNFIFEVNGQTNLVLNGSFEDKISCPVAAGDIDKSRYWRSPSLGTSDYFNACNNSGLDVPMNGLGWSHAASGIAYAGFLSYANNNGREYIQGKFSDTLIFGEQYIVSFYVSLSDFSRYSNNSLGAFISTTAVTGIDSKLLNYSPQIENNYNNLLNDTSNWILITDTFIASGGEMYITIGNFLADSLSDTSTVNNIGFYAYYYIDDVSVMKDTTTGTNEIDRVSKEFSIFPNPVSTNTRITFKNPVLKVNCFLQIFDLKGILLHNININNNNQLLFNNIILNSGIYYLRLTYPDNISMTKKIIKL